MSFVPDEPLYDFDKTPVIEITDIPAEQIQYVRSNLLPGFESCDDATIKRFIRATGANLPLSVKRLNKTLQWRKENNPENTVCLACVKNPRSHYLHMVGHDTAGRPIIYSCLENPTNNDLEDNKKHMIQTFESAIKHMPPGVEQWIWLCDIYGFSVADASTKIAKAFLDISAEHYPERLYKFVILGAPSIFSVLWKAVAPLVDPKTYKKIRIVAYDAVPSKKDEKKAAKALKKGEVPSDFKSQLLDELNSFCDASTRDWILRELAYNRSKKKGDHDVYSYQHLYLSACKGHLLPINDDGEHNIYGCPNLMRLYTEKPDLLLPQGKM
uniref:CRAL-TRIO domain-containing protein n=1 Tax=Polytomella parva TaxID=51329 RepID=A0A7S0UYL0_9CHLO|mmetsp:Transcript_22749/g.40258  ORF Transcript_22749/g.40258 Transcript_22749/m.40258 type:complete len:326 (+) Transcript_22749:85-1062(+)|eukprot:CAMPEP_0175064630 /NCGR_PEP_ID=MMETSP0052_2-20121109/15447_1 /TAXON_ID=51329 ORGANISM="Polytomella parva, Strain SAG 63-3" /NCGR_SAMPLE_ID=MMETSP0052_2 /ASSEMBLY_ACC=CAM_ASM_000194 /LENGTH=325 /DNA_ID=CAMNT_0016331017 /DNA_START=49 /DNA_END=1026 /DNA_ORIENTATION=+